MITTVPKPRTTPLPKLTPTKTAKRLGIDVECFKVLQSALRNKVIDVDCFFPNDKHTFYWPPQFASFHRLFAGYVGHVKVNNLRWQVFVCQPQDEEKVTVTFDSTAYGGRKYELVFDNAENFARCMNELSWNLDLP